MKLEKEMVMRTTLKIPKLKSAVRQFCEAMMLTTAGILGVLGTIQAQNTTSSSMLINTERSIFTHVPDSSQLEFFPLQVGNIWEYRDQLGNPRYCFIEKDSLFPNGYRYFCGGLHWYSISYNGMRIDSMLRVVFYNARSCESLWPGVRPWENIPDGYSYYHLDEPVGACWWVCVDMLKVLNHEQTLVRYTGTGSEYAAGRTCEATYFRMGLIRGVADTSFEYTCILGRGLGIIYEEREIDHMYLVGARINGQVYGTITLDVDNPAFTAEFLEIDPCYPNPAVSEAHVGFSVSQPATVDVDLYDIRGVRVRSIERSIQCSGRYETSFSVRDLPSGQYLCRIRAVGGANAAVKNVMVSIVK